MKEWETFGRYITKKLLCNVHECPLHGCTYTVRKTGLVVSAIQIGMVWCKEYRPTWSDGKYLLKCTNFHGLASKFPREADRFRLPPWAFRPAKYGWKSFLTLTSFPAPIRHFKNLKGTWDKNLSCSHQLQSNFQLLKPLLHAQIFIWNVSLSQKDGVVRIRIWPHLQLPLHRQDECSPSMQHSIIFLSLTKLHGDAWSFLCIRCWSRTSWLLSKMRAT